MNQKSQFSGYKHGKNQKPRLHRSRLNRSIISLVLFFPSVLLAEEKLSYLDALGLASENSPDVRMATADTNIANQQKNKADSILPEAPSLEGSITRGSSTDSIEILDLNNTAISNSGSKPVRGWEVGISQKVDLAGQRGLRQEQGEANQRYYTARLQTSRMEARSRARELYIQATLLSEWEEHLSEHLNRFYRLRARFGGSYIDRRLGSYSLVALNMGIQTLNSERE
ncbi:MAG: TolC family protein, partial [Leptospiraceae bacterium]|nr:TolC family protein [Leptospiraceae bacterium]